MLITVIGSAKKESFKSFFKCVSRLWSPQMVREGIPQTRGSRTEGPITHGAELSPGKEEAV